MWKVACIQLNIQKGKVEENYQNVERYVKEAAEKGANVIVLPELWNTGYDLPMVKVIGDVEGVRTKHFLENLSKTYHVHIVGGSVSTCYEGYVKNTMFVTNNQGKLVGEYSKLHLFQLMNEHLYLEKGNQLGLFQLGDIPCGGNICYDIRFPEWFRTHVYKGAKVMFVVAQWPSVRIDHWEVLLRARAIENQCFVVACNRIGDENNNHFNGRSMIIGPWGEIISKAEDEPILYGDIDIQQVDDIRKRIPVFDDCQQIIYENEKKIN